jgi:hypothetical protein
MNCGCQRNAFEMHILSSICPIFFLVLIARAFFLHFCFRVRSTAVTFHAQFDPGTQVWSVSSSGVDYRGRLWLILRWLGLVRFLKLGQTGASWGKPRQKKQHADLSCVFSEEKLLSPYKYFHSKQTSEQASHFLFTI